MLSAWVQVEIVDIPPYHLKETFSQELPLVPVCATHVDEKQKNARLDDLGSQCRST
jgi:hypothetical protein